MLKSSPYTSIANSHHPFALFRLPYIFSSSTQLHFNIRNDIYQCIIMKFHDLVVNLYFFLYIISFLWYTIFVRKPMGYGLKERIYMKIRRSDLPLEKRVALFRKTGVVCRLTDDDCWELLLPAKVIIVENDENLFWLFDTRNSALLGVVENYTEPEGGILTLLWVFPLKSGASIAPLYFTFIY